MKRYFLFHGAQYYPNGGMEDCLGKFDHIDEAKQHLLQEEGYSMDERGVLYYRQDKYPDWHQWAYIYDVVEDKIVAGANLETITSIRSDLDYLLQYGEAQFIKGLRKPIPDYILFYYKQSREGLS